MPVAVSASQPVREGLHPVAARTVVDLTDVAFEPASRGRVGDGVTGEDVAVGEIDTPLPTVPNMPGVDGDARLPETVTVVREVAPANGRA